MGTDALNLGIVALVIPFIVVALAVVFCPKKPDFPRGAFQKRVLAFQKQVFAFLGHSTWVIFVREIEFQTSPLTTSRMNLT